MGLCNWQRYGLCICLARTAVSAIDRHSSCSTHVCGSCTLLLTNLLRCICSSMYDRCCCRLITDASAGKRGSQDLQQCITTCIQCLNKSLEGAKHADDKHELNVDTLEILIWEENAKSARLCTRQEREQYLKIAAAETAAAAAAGE
jgi:hypothetical protein